MRRWQLMYEPEPEKRKAEPMLLVFVGRRRRSRPEERGGRGGTSK